MASLHKYTQGAAVAMIKHNERTLPPPADGHIDLDRAQDNYAIDLGDDRTVGHAYEYYRKRLSELKHRDRKDAVHLGSWIVTLPKDADKPEEFFSAVTAFLADRYGRDNAISAIVHEDEPNAMPHVHFLFMPGTEDGRLCAKEVLCRSDLRTFHGDLQRYLRQNGLNGTVSKSVTSTKNMHAGAVLDGKRRW